MSHDELAAALTRLAHFGDRLALGDLATVICESGNPTMIMRAMAAAGILSLELSTPSEPQIRVRRNRR